MVDKENPETLWRRAHFELQTDGSEERCPERETLAALVTGESLADRETLADHVVGCRRCTEVARDLAELHREAGDEAPLSRRPFRPWRLALAAALVAGVAALLVGWPRLGPRVSALRGGETVAAAVLPVDGAVLRLAPSRFEFEAGAETSRYRVVLFDAESTVVWQSPEGQATTVEVPPDVRHALPPGSYFWRVETFAGVERRRSPLYRFTLGR